MTINDKPQAHSRDVFGLTILKSNHPDIRRLKREHKSATIHGNKFWKSTNVMIDYLNVEPPQRHWRILEIGCGWGVSSIYCAKHFQASVTALDADAAVFPFLHHHARLNDVQVSTLNVAYEKLTVAMLAQFDMVIGSDICFWDEMNDLLFNLINRIHTAGVHRVVITDPGRSPFLQMAERCCEKFDAIYDHWSIPHPHNTSGMILDIS
ncbi:MAG: putative nicotinamide N-methyase [Pseudohongiellaceae bacterium]|jgi:predicted nicotinamide N-methyase